MVAELCQAQVNFIYPLFFSRLPHLLYLKRSSYKILEYSSEECGGTMCKLGGYNTNQTDQGN